MDAETGLQSSAYARGTDFKTMPVQSINSSKSSTLGESPIQSDVERSTGEAIPEIPSLKRLNTARRRRDRPRRQKAPAVWKKILWVKQSRK